MAERLAVLLYGQVVGRLDRTVPGALPTFSYDDAYVASGSVPLSLRLPIAPTTYPEQRVEPYLRGLLPENRETLGRWADRLGVAVDDILALLAEALVVERFDRIVGGDGSVVRVHQEDFCQAIGRLPEAKYESRGGPGLIDMAGVVKKWSSQRDDDLMALADFAAINLVAGAPDGHSKNISLLLAHDGQRRIAPLYDLATGLSYDRGSVERSVALSVGGERIFSRIRRRQWEKSARTLGLEPDLVVNRTRTLAERYPDAFERAVANIQDVPGADEVGARTLPALREHCKNLVQQLG